MDKMDHLSLVGDCFIKKNLTIQDVLPYFNSCNDFQDVEDKIGKEIEFYDRVLNNLKFVKLIASNAGDMSINTSSTVLQSGETILTNKIKQMLDNKKLRKDTSSIEECITSLIKCEGIDIINQCNSEGNRPIDILQLTANFEPDEDVKNYANMYLNMFNIDMILNKFKMNVQYNSEQESANTRFNNYIDYFCTTIKQLHPIETIVLSIEKNCNKLVDIISKIYSIINNESIDDENINRYSLTQLLSLMKSMENDKYTVYIVNNIYNIMNLYISGVQAQFLPSYICTY